MNSFQRDRLQANAADLLRINGVISSVSRDLASVMDDVSSFEIY